MTTAVYVFGPPGVGKSTFTRRFLEARGAVRRHGVAEPVPHVTAGAWVELGKDRHPFGGTDALSYAIAPAARAWIESEARPPLLIAEGDRLASEPFFDALIANYEQTVLVFLAGREVAHRRMRERAIRLDKPVQNEAWWKGRATKCERLAARYPAWTIQLQASQPCDVLVSEVGRIIAP